MTNPVKSHKIQLFWQDIQSIMNPGSASAKKIGIIAAVGLALAIVVYVLVAQKRPAPQVTFNTLAGKAVSLQSLRGKVVLVSFWATTCPGCIKEMPELVIHRGNRGSRRRQP